MLKKNFLNLFIKILKSGLVKINKQGFLKSLISQSYFTSNENLILAGENYIHDTALFIFNTDSKVLLKGQNRIGRNVEIQPCEGKTIELGYGTTIQDRNIILGDVVFGRFCLTAPNVYISSGRHYFEKYPHLYIKDQDYLVHNDSLLKSLHSQKVVIEDDVWIGINSVIMSGVKIGRGSVIGSNSVVTSDVPPFSVVAGAPAKIIKKRLAFEPKIQLSFENNYDLPNFYSGIYVDSKSLEKTRKMGGVLCSKNFTLYVSNIGNKIKLNLCNTMEYEIYVQHNKQRVKLDTKEFTDLYFNTDNNNFLSFDVLNSKNEGIDDGLLIKEVNVLTS
jgi:acetyltransferase-like isoleucine patch superfamily enzyme